MATQAALAQVMLQQAIEHLAPNASIILARDPLIDPNCPLTSDLDLLVFGKVNDLLPERLHLTSSVDPAPMIDLIWLPEESLSDDKNMAQNGLIPHRLLSSRVVYDQTGGAAAQWESVRLQMYRPEIQRQRLTGFFDMGFYTVREIGVTWDFPAMALFWLHIAHTACLAAMLDEMRYFCPNVYTRPFDYLSQAEEASGLSLEKPFIEALHLDVEPLNLIAPLRRIHQVVSSRFPEPEWPPNMRHGTRYEYRYFLSSDELDWRISVAEEMIGQGALPAAVYYLRFMAYLLARIPMVHRRAGEGVNIPFVRPARAMRPDLEKHCPEILGDLNNVLAGREPLSADTVNYSLGILYTFREQALMFLKSRDIELTELRTWRPFEPSPQKA